MVQMVQPARLLAWQQSFEDTALVRTIISLCRPIISYSILSHMLYLICIYGAKHLRKTVEVPLTKDDDEIIGS